MRRVCKRKSSEQYAAAEIESCVILVSLWRLIRWLSDHLLPMHQIPTQEVHHLGSAQVLELRQVCILVLLLLLGRLAVCRLDCRSEASMFLPCSHLDLSLSYVALHSSSWPSYIVPGKFLQPPILCLGRFLSGCAIAAVMPIARSVCHVRLRRLCDVVLGRSAIGRGHGVS